MRRGGVVQARKTFDFSGQLVCGVAFDGQSLWASIIVDGQGSLARIDRETGAVVSRVATDRIAGLAWDGSHLWAITPSGIVRIDPKTLAVVKTLPRPAIDGAMSGLAWDGEALWAGTYHQKKILKIDPATGAVLREVASDRFVTGITWLNGDLWHVVDDEDSPPRPTEMRRIDADTGAVLEGIELPFSITGLDHDGDAFWCGDSNGSLRLVNDDKRG
jgi:hypothetical protein